MEPETRDTQLGVRYHSDPPVFPAISKPTSLGFFSVELIDNIRKWIPGTKQLKYLKVPPPKDVRFDLTLGYENVIKKPEPLNEQIDHLLRFILENKHKLLANPESNQNQPALLNIDFICFRGLLRLIMTTPYEYREDWKILVTKYRGNIYLCEKKTEQKRNTIELETPISKKLCSYGFKFEQYMLTDDPQKEPNTNVPVNEAEECCCMFRTNLQGHKILYGAEMDGILSDELIDISKIDPSQLEFIELKVKRKETSLSQRKNFLKFKLRNWWCQSFLVGINKIYMGLRNDRGIVNEISLLHLRDIPKMAREFWEPAVCLDFLSKFLAMVKQTVRNTDDCPLTVYEFYWHPQGAQNIVYRLHQGRNDLTFLPDWYISEFK